MTTDLLDFPTIDAVPMPAVDKTTGDTRSAAEPQDVAEIRDGTAIVKLNRTEAGLAKLRADLAGKTYDLTTTAGDKAARADRLRCVTLRSDTEKLRKALKAPALDFGRKVDAEAKRITDAVEALEAPIDEAIKADERRREEERLARERAEALRIASLKGRVDTFMAGWVSRCNTEGMTAARIASGIAMLHQQQVPEDLQDVAAYFTEAQTAALRRMEDARYAAERREEEARLEAQRIEQERQAAELARQRAELEAAAAALAAEKAAAEAAALALRQQAEAEAARKLAAAAVQDMAMGDAPDPVEPDPATLVEPAPHDTSADAPVFVDFDTPAVATDATEPVATDATPAAESAQATLPTVAEEAPTLKLGAIAEKLGFVLTEAFIASTLNIAVRGRDKRAVLWRESDWPAIKAALVEHVKALP